MAMGSSACIDQFNFQGACLPSTQARVTTTERRIEDYALIGDCHSAALSCNDGSIDWLCWPRFDSPACLAALLGTPGNGRWSIAPVDADNRVRRQYRAGTLILETRFETASGSAVLTDFMPLRGDAPRLIRTVTGLSGTLEMQLELILRFDYGISVPWATQLPDDEGEGMSFIVGPNRVILRSSIPVHGEHRKTVTAFAVAAGQSLSFELCYSESHLPIPARIDPALALLQLEPRWRAWSSRCHNAGQWAQPVERSLIVLKALIYEPTGGIVAAPTTSLPECLGGTRNWDYRFCWLRDATLTLTALMLAGFYAEARAWRAWLVRAIAGDASQLQIMYGISGERQLDEREIGALPGFANSIPVRVGNQASNQLQLDVYGELMDALYQCRKMALPNDQSEDFGSDDSIWHVQCAMLTHLETIWQHPDEGIWEVRGGRQHFTYSKIMAWVAFDRAVKSVEHFGVAGPVEHWRIVRDTIHQQVCERGFNPQRNSFVQSYGNDSLDASLLHIPLVGFLPADDPRVIATVAAIERELVVDGFVMRYLSHEVKDGLPGGEGAFLACSFWLVDNLALQGRLTEAHRLFERLLAVSNDVGLLAEEYDPIAGLQLGNFPQAFSHVALIHTAFNLLRSRQSEPMPAELRIE
jgi:GH15 family glucan-1,4-alpha-glucosidase